MRCIHRYHELRESDLGSILSKIRLGQIKCGKYAHLVKIDPTKKIDRKRLFCDEKTDTN